MQTINKGCGNRRRTASWAHRLMWLAGAALLAGADRGVRADEPDAATTARARYVAITVCGTCHGVTGNSTYPKFPRLAGQDVKYLVRQLKAFRDQTRGDPDAIGYMWGMAAQLNDETIEALAAYYAAQTPGAGSGSAPALIARGREIYQHGVTSQGVPACISCHGPDAHGQGDYPRLAGQHAQYVLKQLGSFQSNMRKVAIMHGVALNLQDPEMAAVAAYLRALP
jgi:cytochrome c553